MDTNTAGGGFDTSPFTHRRQEPNTSNRIRPEPHRRPPSEKALQRPIEPPGRHTGHDHSSQFLRSGTPTGPVDLDHGHPGRRVPEVRPETSSRIIRTVLTFGTVVGLSLIHI